MEFEDCRSEASIGLEDSISTVSDDEKHCISVPQQNCSSSSGKRKRKRNSPPSSPTAIEDFHNYADTKDTSCPLEFAFSLLPVKNIKGFGESEAGDILKQFPELGGIFTVVRKVGEGTFSNVYLAKVTEFPYELCALKHIIPTSGPERIENELRCLQTIGGRDNVVGIETAYRKNDHIVFVLPYVPHQKFQDYYLEMSVCEIRQYMKNLFIALKRVHSFDIIHRDVKPSNFLYSRESKQFSLVDFGLAMPVPGSTKSLFGSSKVKNITPKPISRHLPRRSARLSPQMENSKENQKGSITSGNTRPFLKSSVSHSGNSRFACQSKNFKMPVSKNHTGPRTQLDAKQTVASKTHKNHTGPRTQLDAKQTVASKTRKLLCPVKHSSLEICSACLSRGHQNAPRAGTPGFRSPEVLLKCPNQTTAIDIWSGGVIMLCLLSGRYPFFRAYDDMTALAQIISVIGSSECIKSASDIGKDLILNAELPQGDLKAACQRLRLGSSKFSPSGCIALHPDRHDSTLKRARRKSPISKKCQSNDSKPQNNMQHQWCSFCREAPNPISSTHPCPSLKCIEEKDQEHLDEHLDGTKCTSNCCKCCWAIPSSAYDLLQRCLDLNPQTRITASQALQHPFFVT